MKVQTKQLETRPRVPRTTELLALNHYPPPSTRRQKQAGSGYAECFPPKLSKAQNQREHFIFDSS
jgi:hypothetical protein